MFITPISVLCVLVPDYALATAPNIKLQISHLVQESIDQLRHLVAPVVLVGPKRWAIDWQVSQILTDVVGIDGDIPWAVSVVERLSKYNYNHLSQLLVDTIERARDQFLFKLLPALNDLMTPYLNDDTIQRCVKLLETNFDRAERLAHSNWEHYSGRIKQDHDYVFRTSIVINARAIAARKAGQQDLSVYDGQLNDAKSIVKTSSEEKERDFFARFAKNIHDYAKRLVRITNGIADQLETIRNSADGSGPTDC